MKFLAITALLVAGTLAMPASNSCPPPGGDHKPPPPPPPSHPSPSPTPSYPPPPNNGGGYYPPPPDNTSHTPPPPSSTPPHNGGGGDGGNDGGSGNTGGGNSDDGSDGGHFLCPTGLFSSAQCCSTDVLGIADLNCKPPSKTPKDASDFAKICSSTGSEARCCAIPIAGQALLCQDVVGI
ncbi:hypothetical protein ACSS6W_000231 [Trichoderma asperelloides]